MGLVGLGRAVRHVVGAGEHGVLAGDVDDVAAHALRDHGPGGLARDEERSTGHHVVLHVPVRHRRVQQRLGDGQAGVVHDEVDATERERRGPDRRRHGRLVGHVDGDRDGGIRSADLGRDGGRAGCVPVGDDHAGAFGREPQGRGATDARSAAGDERDAAGQRLRLRQAGELRLFQRPILDAELLRLGDRRVRRDCLGATHHVDGVDVELAGHPGGLLVRAEGEHARRRARGRSPGRRRASVASRASRAAGSRPRTPRGRRRAARAAERSRRRAAPWPAGRRRGGAPSYAGSGPGTTCPARPAADAPPGPGSRGRHRCRCSGRAAAGRSTRARGSPGSSAAARSWRSASGSGW